MSTLTPNLGLIKPDGPDPANTWPAEYNANLNTLDGALVASDYESYAPSFTATVTNPTLGTGGAVNGRYITIGPFLTIVRIMVIMGTSGFNPGDGFYRLTLPFTHHALHVAGSTGVGDIIGRAFLRDATSASASATANCALINTTTIQMQTEDASPSSLIRNDSPFVWGNNDYLVLMAKYLRA